MFTFRRLVTPALSILVVLSSAGAISLRADQSAKPGHAKFDYIVIGGGTAGLTIAARLAETASVAVVEAGGYYEIDYGNVSVIPLNNLIAEDVADPTIDFPRRPYIDWELVTQPLANSNNRVIHYAQGKTLGGSSALNSMSYTRSARSSYQRWADQVGDASYTFDNLLPFYKESVRLTPPNLVKRNAANATPEYDPNSFGNGGPLDVSWNNWVDPTLTWLAKALQAVGLAINPKGWSAGDLNGGSWTPSTIDPSHATRETSQTSFLNYALANTSLKVYHHSLASKILFNGKKASGVSVSTNGSAVYTLSAKKEVILSAGTLHSPQLLMLSGIGPKDTLNSHRIPVLSNLPGVGQNLRDPIALSVGRPVNTISAQAIVANPALKPEALRQYYEEAAGPYSSVAGYIAFERFPADIRATLPAATQEKLAFMPSDQPEIQYIAGATLVGNDTIGLMGAMISNVFSRGSVSISSANVSDQPIIDLGWLSDPADGDVLIAAIKRLRQAWVTQPAQTISVGPESQPGAEVVTDEDLLEWVRNNALQMWHASSTCAMGKKEDRDAVVDTKARVFGVRGLRVVDLSIVPFSLPGQPQSMAYMLAEKIADDIKNGTS